MAAPAKVIAAVANDAVQHLGCVGMKPEQLQVVAGIGKADLVPLMYVMIEHKIAKDSLYLRHPSTCE